MAYFSHLTSKCPLTRRRLLCRDTINVMLMYLLCPMTRRRLLCRDTINVMLMYLLINMIKGFNAQGRDMKNRRKSVSTSVKTW